MRHRSWTENPSGANAPMTQRSTPILGAWTESPSGRNAPMTQGSMPILGAWTESPSGANALMTQGSTPILGAAYTNCPASNRELLPSPVWTSRSEVPPGERVRQASSVNNQ
jgi:hypothetical protein